MNFITGIQQIGIGTTDAYEAAKYYADLFGMQTLLFDDTAEAKLMMRYTGGKAYRRRAMLTMNMQGGGGFELWQFLDRTPAAPVQHIIPGDVGIYAIKIKCKDVHAAHSFFLGRADVTTTPVTARAGYKSQFFVTDAYHNTFNIVPAADMFATGTHVCGGVCGVVIGVTEIEKSLAFYKQFLGAEQQLFRATLSVYDEGFPAGEVEIVRLFSTCGKSGAFCNLLGATDIELLELKQHQPKKITANRYWGDPGFIHVCFDVINMQALKELGATNGYHFTVDSEESFSMQKAGGRFCYVEDNNGTLIELVETHRVPVIKKLGLYFNLKKRLHKKPLPSRLVKLMGLNKLR